MPALTFVITASASTHNPARGFEADEVLQIDRQEDIEADDRPPAERIDDDGEPRLMIAEDRQRDQRLRRGA